MDRQIIRVEYEEPTVPEIVVEEQTEFERSLPDTATVEVRQGEAEGVYERVMDAFDEYESEYSTDIPYLVLGEEDYVLLDVLLQDDGSGGVESYFAPTEVVTVPGRMVHVPRPEEHVRWEVANSNYD